MDVAKSRTAEYFESLSNTMVRFSPYAVLKTGMNSSQTFLKIEDYTLICSPFQLSMKKAILLLILSQEETRFFQKYKDESSTLNMTFKKPGTEHTAIFDVNGKIDRIGPVKDKQNLCMIDLSFSNHPDDLVEIIGDFILSFNALRGYYETYQGKEIPIDENMARMLRYNNYMECFVASRRIRSELVSISASRLTFDIQSNTPEIIEGYKFSAKLYFQLYQFVVQGMVDSIEGYGGDILRVSSKIEFAPELIEIMDDYFYRLTHSTANPRTPNPAS